MFLDSTWLDKPKLFISSTMDKNTFVHRKEIIEGLQKDGYEIVEFQSSSFPYTNFNDSSVINETINAVAKANLFILIVDEKYGSLIDTKSVIHHEYKKAIELNLPIFVFINDYIWSDFYKGNVGEASTIKTQELFDFIKELAIYKISAFGSASDCLTHVKQQLLNYMGGFLKFARQAMWLWNENYTRSIEKSAQEVWIVTPDFLWDFDDPEFHQIVITNVIERQCIYKYIYKESIENKAKQEEMMRIYRLKLKGKPAEQTLAKQVQFLPVKSDRFYWSCEQILFNPMGLEERAIMVDIMDVRDRTLKFNVEYGLQKRMQFRKQFISYWNTFGKTHCEKICEQ